ncbi:MAG: LuxR C-terminal-related transcriptional regulator [Alphaproteobacteria bacterium]
MTGSGSSSVIIADDHALVRNALRAVFDTIEGVEVVGEAADGVEAIALGKSKQPDLMTLDSAMPLANGLEAFVELRRWSPGTRFAVVTGFTGLGELSQWAGAGVDGLFLKTCPPSEMAHGFTVLLRGESYFSKAVITALEGASETAALTLRERQILHLIAAGRSNKEISEKLSISAKTVDNHRTRMMAKLNVHSIAQLIAHALKEGLLDHNTQL